MYSTVPALRQTLTHVTAGPMLASVADGGPKLNQRCVKVLCLLGWPKICCWHREEEKQKLLIYYPGSLIIRALKYHISMLLF